VDTWLSTDALAEISAKTVVGVIAHAFTA